jgi:hypothetical protein
VIVSEAAWRRRFAAACRRAGLAVHAVERISEIERWPEAQIVVTDAAHLTPWWSHVGATHVILAAGNDDETEEALRHGATSWIHVETAPATLAAILAAAAATTGC